MKKYLKNIFKKESARKFARILFALKKWLKNFLEIAKVFLADFLKGDLFRAKFLVGVPSIPRSVCP